MVSGQSPAPTSSWFVKATRAASVEHDETWKRGGVCPTLNDFDNNSETRATVVMTPTATTVRRLTPRECERLMGWPDDHTRYAAGPDGPREQSDSHRYRQCGNGMAAPVVEWIARRIVEVDE